MPTYNQLSGTDFSVIEICSKPFYDNFMLSDQADCHIEADE